MDDYKITTKNELAAAISLDEQANLGGKKLSAGMKFRDSFPVEVVRLLHALRRLEYALSQKESTENPLAKAVLSQKIKLFDRHLNTHSHKLNIYLIPFHTAPGTRICHQNVILNGKSAQGCIFHGDNVLGNKTAGDKLSVPILGKNVEVGIGAKIIGKIYIADDCKIGAGAVVTKSFETPGTVIVGVPAKAAQKENK